MSTRVVHDEDAGIIQGPFKDCDCPSHHQHCQRGMAGCPVCTPGFKATCVKCGQVDTYDKPVSEIYYCGYGCT